MRPHAIRAAGLFALLCAASTGCGDTPSPTAPSATGPSAGLLSSVLQVSLLQRLLPLGKNYSASATIGTAGGTIRIREAGMTITFPAGAVSAPVTVRATALAGSNVAYTFEPHGLVFQKDPTIVQDLGVTEIVRQLLFPPPLAGGYFTDESQITGTTAKVVETRSATVDLLRLQMSFTVHHFSGYAVTTSKTGYITSSGTRTATNGGGVR